MDFKIGLLEPNSVPGFTNRVLGLMGDSIFLNYESAKRYFKPEKCHMVGNPIRGEILAPQSNEGSIHKTAKFTVLILGGSQGAVGLNNLVLETLKCRGQFYQAIKEGNLQIIHQSGILDLDRVNQTYQDLDLVETGNIEVMPFIGEMGPVYAITDLVVSRSGASAVSEITQLGKPALFVPFPQSSDNHQEINAREVESVGGARVILQREAPEKFGNALIKILQNPNTLENMRQSMLNWAKPDAAKKIVDILLESDR